ncbi:hypothetical protein Tco_1015438 [Tanacetum coccineum]|uniref:Uncharacterized protein n=1 Tax=Tanacetum coccineum TaxID=301880 RepID=A0ABQ5FKT7_9ASTR
MAITGSYDSLIQEQTVMALRKCILTRVILESEKEANSFDIGLIGIGDEIYINVEHVRQLSNVGKHRRLQNRTSSNTRNKNVDTTPRYKNDNQTGQFGNQRAVNVVGRLDDKLWEGVQLSKQSNLMASRLDEEIGEQELEAHYSYMAKIQEVPNADSGTDAEPLEHVQYDTDDNVFANDIQHFEQSESITNHIAVERV